MHPPCPQVQSSEGLRRYLFLPWGPLFQAVLVRLCLPSLRHPLRKKSHHLGLTLMQCDVWGDGKEKASSVSVPSAQTASLPHPHPRHFIPSSQDSSLPCPAVLWDVFVPLSTYPSGRPSLSPSTPCSPRPPATALPPLSALMSIQREKCLVAKHPLASLCPVCLVHL